MEATVWLLIKMGGLLALAGVVFFSLGWWARGQQKGPAAATPRKKPEAERPPASNEPDQHSLWAKEIAELKAERDHLLNLVSTKTEVSPVSEPVAKRPTKPRSRKTKR